MSEIDSALNGNRVDLKNAIEIFFRAVAIEYLNTVINFVQEKLTLGPIKIPFPKLDSTRKRCVIDSIFNQIYKHTDATDELVDLLQNIATAVGVIKQVNMEAL